MSLDQALRFATEVRAERFHNPDDVFIVDDASGETVSEVSLRTDGVVETIPEAPPPSAVQENAPGEKGDLETLLTYVGRWQLRHAQLTVRGGQRLTSMVESSLRQLAGLIEQLGRSDLFNGDVAQLVADTDAAVEQLRKVRDLLTKMEAKLQFLLASEEAIAAKQVTPTQPQPQPPSKKKPRGKG